MRLSTTETPLWLSPLKKEKFYFAVTPFQSILGYTPEEVMGYGFWKLTEDP